MFVSFHLHFELFAIRVSAFNAIQFRIRSYVRSITRFTEQNLTLRNISCYFFLSFLHLTSSDVIFNIITFSFTCFITIHFWIHISRKFCTIIKNMRLNDNDERNICLSHCYRHYKGFIPSLCEAHGGFLRKPRLTLIGTISGINANLRGKRVIYMSDYPQASRRLHHRCHICPWALIAERMSRSHNYIPNNVNENLRDPVVNSWLTRGLFAVNKSTI